MRRLTGFGLTALACLLPAGCGSEQPSAGDDAETRGDGSNDEDGSDSQDGNGDQSGDDQGDADDDQGDGDGDGDDEADDGDDGPDAKFDLTPIPDMTPFDPCPAQDLDILADEGLALPCDSKAPPESFDPVIEWQYPEDNDAGDIRVTPLVINWTNDNGDGLIDMCDTPDVVLLMRGVASVCDVHIIDGDYGNTQLVHHVFSNPGIHCDGNPAVGDIDNDGEPELVAVSNKPEDRLIAIDNDGTVMWESEQNPYIYTSSAWTSGGVALHDIDGDGSYEILYNHLLFDNQGQLLWAQEDPAGSAVWLQATTAADLDGDGDLELLTAFSAHDFDEAWEPTTLWDFVASEQLPPFSVPHVANFDDDPEPEVLYSSDAGYLLVEHDGTIKWGPIKPTFDQLCLNTNWRGYMRAGAIHDYDGDGQAEFAAAACGTFAVYDITETGPVLLTQKPVEDVSGGTATTAFDFLGDATPEPVYSDETRAWAWSRVGGVWETRLELPRASPTLMEYPSIADVDNDGSAEILVPSASLNSPALVVFGDEEDRWIQARRIYNQHAYHVVHTNEDGTVPTQTLRNWEYLNTFRANSQIESGGVCQPQQ